MIIMPERTSVSLKLEHIEGMKFEAETTDGRKVELNSADQMGQAFTPMELFLVSIAGCTAMDVQWIMDKQRQTLDKLEVFIRGTRRGEDPRYYETINLEYVLAGRNIAKDAVERAIRLSQEKYCSVRAMIKDGVKINVTYRMVNGDASKERFVHAAEE